MLLVYPRWVLVDNDEMWGLAGLGRPRAIIISPAHGPEPYYRPRCLGRALATLGPIQYVRLHNPTKDWFFTLFLSFQISPRLFNLAGN